MTTWSRPLVLTADSTLGQLCHIPSARVTLLLIVSLCPSCFLRVSLSCFRVDPDGPSYLALRMTYSNNPQSRQLAIS